MPQRKRASANRGLPTRWQWHHGTIYYRVPQGLEHQWDGRRRFPLGKTLTEAHRTWARRVEMAEGRIHTMGQLLDWYAATIIPRKAQRTQTEHARAVQRLKAVFDQLPVDQIRPRDAYRYHAERSKQAATVAKHEVQVLRHALTEAVQQLGLLDHNPLIGALRLNNSTGRERYVEDWEIVEALSLQPAKYAGRTAIPVIQAYIRLKLLTSLRMTDLLTLSQDDIRNDGLYIRPHKTTHSSGKAAIYEWTDELYDAVQLALAVRPVDISPWVFCTRSGKCYVPEHGRPSGFESSWQRFMQRCLEHTRLEQRFAERDLRAKCATDADSLEHARSLLVHADDRTTRKWYRRRPERVKPAR